MKCKYCGTELDESAKVCKNCGNTIIKCKKCGSLLKKEDQFCPECGSKVDDVNNEKQLEQVNKTETPIKKEKKSNKKKIVFALVLVVVIIAGLLYFFLQPKDIHIEASELNELINENNAEKYYGDNLYVHGYLMRGSDSSSSYVLFSSEKDIDDLNIENSLPFVYEGNISDDLGTKSEITVEGKLAERTADGSVVFHGEAIAVQKKIKPQEAVSKTCSFNLNGNPVELVINGLDDKVVSLSMTLTAYGSDMGVNLNAISNSEKKEIEDAILNELGLDKNDGVKVEITDGKMIFNFIIDLNDKSSPMLKLFGIDANQEYSVSDFVKNITNGGGYCY